MNVGYFLFEAIETWHDGSISREELSPRGRVLYEKMFVDHSERGVVPEDTGTLSGRAKRLAIASGERDTSFFANHLSYPVMRHMDFLAEKRVEEKIDEEKKDSPPQVVESVIQLVTRENWEEVRLGIVSWTGENTIPEVCVAKKADDPEDGTLFLEHVPYVSGREIDAKDAEEVVKHLAHLWKAPVCLRLLVAEEEFEYRTDAEAKGLTKEKPLKPIPDDGSPNIE